MADDQVHRENADGLVKILESRELVDGLWSVLDEEWFDKSQNRLVIPEVVLENWNRLSKYMSYGTTASVTSSPATSSRSASIEPTTKRRRRTGPSFHVWTRIMELVRVDFQVDNRMEELSRLNLEGLLDGHPSHVPVLNHQAGKPWPELPKYIGRLKAQNVANYVRLVVIRLAIHNAVTIFTRQDTNVDSNQAPHLTERHWRDFIAKHWDHQVDGAPENGADVLRWIRSESKIAYRYHLVVTQVQPVGYAVLVHLVANQLITDNQFKKELALTTETGQMGLKYLKSLHLGEIPEMVAWSNAIEAWYDAMCVVLRS
ncbi:hypothetical protein SVAN01_09366 [Stagonosporopsis vannaccii]|nr:hypothetical protein SVAN01_09366 [Stagonosporopsis vannaccii]